MILGTRGSALALAQSGWVRDRLVEARPGLDLRLQIIRTTGDHRQGAPAEPISPASSSPDGKGVFVKEIEEALLAGGIDLAVHSLKDLPTEQPEGLLIACVPRREDPRDALISRGGLALQDLPRGARVGTGSPRRAAQLLAARPDLVLAPLRGNVDTRVHRMLEGRFDAVVLAAAGLIRLGALDRPPSSPGSGGALGVAGMLALLPVDACVPAVGQGALALEARASDGPAREIAAALHDSTTAASVTAERAFLAALGGGCRVPVAALAAPAGGDLRMRAVVASLDGRRLVRVEGEGPSADPGALGRRLAGEALARGAAAILAEGRP